MKNIPLILFCLLLLQSGCSTSPPTSKQNNAVLVEENAPVFEKRFRELAIDDLNLDNFWLTSPYPAEKGDVVITNNTIAKLADRTKEGVVNIYTRKLELENTKFGINPGDVLPLNIPLVSNLLKVIPFQVPIPHKTEGVSLGSGFIINYRGFILTNAHVVHNATDIQVVLSEGKKEYPAKIIGIDRLTDLALLKIEPDTTLTPLPLGNSDDLRVGEMVVAQGNPLGLKHSVTSGIVSAVGRNTPTEFELLVDFIQTDSAINPGSSGGPLLNIYGEVVGINTAIISSAQSIGFAIPVNVAKEVMPLLITSRTERGWVGAQVQPIDLKSAEALGFSDENGILVTKVFEKSPARKSGLQDMDIITAVNGETFYNFNDFRRKLVALTPGTTIEFQVFRKGEIRTITITAIRKTQ